MSAALVPGRILLDAPWSGAAFSLISCVDGPPAAPWLGDLGPICTSGNGGGLGRRGEVDGDRLPVGARFVAMSCWARF